MGYPKRKLKKLSSRIKNDILVSIEGLIKTAENLDKLGEPVISLSRKILSLLTGGVVK